MLAASNSVNTVATGHPSGMSVVALASSPLHTEILEPDEVSARVEAVTAEQIASLASRLWAPEHLSAAGIGPDEGVFDAAVAEACPTLQPTA